MIREKLQKIFGEEQAIIAAQMLHVTRDPPLVEAEIRARLLRRLLRETEPQQKPDWVEPRIIKEET